jgi:hypothetical protein
MPWKNRATVARKLKHVQAGAIPSGLKKKSSARRIREARERTCNPIHVEDVAAQCITAQERSAAIAQCRATCDINEIVLLLSHHDAAVRIAALHEVCPCRMDEDDDDVWSTICSMAADHDLGVRKQVLHTLCDGSPAHREAQVLEAIEMLGSEEDRDLRRMVHKVLASFHRTGEWNIM